MNPIIAMLNGKQTNNLLAQLSAIRNPEAYFQQMMQSNPQFKSFVEANRGKSVDQIMQDYGIDPALVKQFM